LKEGSGISLYGKPGNEGGTLARSMRYSTGKIKESRFNQSKKIISL